MRFTELLKQINETYPEFSKRFRVLAVRYWLGIDSIESLKGRCANSECVLTDRLTHAEVSLIIRNR
jgi:hypothetical protein